jgi:hypothetical protein
VDQWVVKAGVAHAMGSVVCQEFRNTDMRGFLAERSEQKGVFVPAFGEEDGQIDLRLNERFHRSTRRGHT